MSLKRLSVLLNILFMVSFSRYYNISVDAYNSNLDIRGITLKISLIQTAYEIYNVNVLNTNIYTEDLYKEFGKDAYTHYKWLKNTYKSMDKNMINCLENIFKSKNPSEYINAVVELDDDSNLITIVSKIINNKLLNLTPPLKKDIDSFFNYFYNEYFESYFNKNKNKFIKNIVSKIINNKLLNLTPPLKKDIDSFFNYFYNEYFESYFNKNKNKFIKKAKNLNKILNDCNVDIKKFIENYSGLKLNDNFKTIFYFNFNPLSSYKFNSDNIIISTISIDINAQDLLSLAFHSYSHSLFSEFAYDDEFLKIYNYIQDKNIIKNYDNYKTNYPFNIWCVENLIEGFSKFLYYNYCKNIYEYNVYEYDLDFYNYLKDINFTPNEIHLKKASINFLKLKINKNNIY